jgi:hypothetical protein
MEVTIPAWVGRGPDAKGEQVQDPGAMDSL